MSGDFGLLAFEYFYCTADYVVIIGALAFLRYPVDFLSLNSARAGQVCVNSLTKRESWKMAHKHR